MISAILATKLREEATCPICLKFMTEPVSIDCGHIYCRLCIVGLTEYRSPETSSPGTFPCPQCREPFKSDSLRPNKPLRSIIETFKEMDQKMCKEHGKQLHLFCEDDGQLICWRCERSPQHKGHVTALVEDACQGYREQLQKAVIKLSTTRLDVVKHRKGTIRKLSDWKEKIKHEEERIHSEFRSLHTFLHEEEKFYMCQLKKENEQQLSRLQGNVEYLENKFEELTNCILELEEKCQGSAQNLLQDIKDTLRRNSAIYVVTPMDISLEVHTVCNVSELNFSVRKMLRRYQENVTLDLGTVHLDLPLSNNQRTVAHKGSKAMYETPGGFPVFPCVLGRERFTSGRHYFEVAVREGTEWGVGVCLENVSRDIDIVREPQSGFWTIRLTKDKSCLALSSPPTTLYLSDQPKVVGINLDYDLGFVSFYNATTGSLIYKFPKVSFSRALKPYFEVYPFSPLSLIFSNE
ncbi:E3 ubiquitin-protein ligase TRIM38-like [Sorex araneus]|uniref:E3 ubiquitin-protein ligase TRIM38-like n=1 Tax=Sorex araneus TaxID=42254 RepID=UPI002433A2B7|nr:E3 ubiquitin-protein ligase TRIM38-like [Sorex araneus]